MESIHIGSDNLVQIRGLRSAASGGTYINNATGTIRLKSDAGVNVGASINLAYVAASDGIYEATIPASETTGLTEGATYRIYINIATPFIDQRVVRRQAQINREL